MSPAQNLTESAEGDHGKGTLQANKARSDLLQSDAQAPAPPESTSVVFRSRAEASMKKALFSMQNCTCGIEHLDVGLHRDIRDPKGSMV